MAYSTAIAEEELKNKVAHDVFGDYDCTRIFGKVDFCVSVRTAGPTLWETESLLWAEAKKGVRADFAPLFAQLVLTIGGEKTFEKHSPPPFLGAFDSERIAFLPWHVALDLFFRSDVDWTAAPSDAGSPAFLHVLDLVRPILAANLVSFRFDDPDLPKFAKRNLVVGNDRTNRLPVTRNNFPFVYQKWVRAVKPSIAVDWALARKQGIHDADFFLADLLSKNNATLLPSLFVVLRGDHYDLDRKIDPSGFVDARHAFFKDGQAAHTQFWNQYRRPPRKEFWGFINDRRDLLMPADIRERQGSFFTPQIWVEKAQEAIAAVLGENWQDDHCVWDCAAGTGNLLAGLDPKARYRVWASTLQQADVDVMHERIRNGAALLDSHVFRFDFLNDSFDDLPDGLKTIVQDPERRKKLVVFINPPYAEATTPPTKSGPGMKPEVAKGTLAHDKFKPMIGQAANEMFALFLIRLVREIPGCIIGQFSTLKHLRAPNFKRFRAAFHARLDKAFIVPANTFDNVNGEFPIGFFVWNTVVSEPLLETTATVFNSSGVSIGTKRIQQPPTLISDWTARLRHACGTCIGYERMQGSDFQNSQFTNIVNSPSEAHATFLPISAENLLPACVHFAVRLCVEDNWLVHNDLFLFPADSWKRDREFQTDCLVFTIFHAKNRISCKAGSNHWIPFKEDEVGARDCMKSHFMSEFLEGLLEGGNGPASRPGGGLFAEASLPGLEASEEEGRCGGDGSPSSPKSPMSPEARAVLEAGRALWRHYHAQPGALPDASYYDIRAHFQGFKPNGHMNAESPDGTYMMLVGALRTAERALAAKLAPKVFEHGFLR